jgi:protease-4
MPSFPLSPRLFAAPVWGVLALRERLVSRGNPILELRLGGRHPLPSPRALRAIAHAPEIRGIHIEVDGVAEGWATLSAAREALLAVRKAGKFVSFELEQCGNAELYLASVGDRVWLRPMVQVHLYGVGAVLRFAGDALARFGLSFDVEAAGAYKSFGETFTRSFASPENREAMTEIVDGLQAELERGIAEGRNIPVEQVRSAVRDAPLDAEVARERGLIDGALYPDAVRAELQSHFGPEQRRIPFARWYRAWSQRTRMERWTEARRRIAVVTLVGTVVDGDGGPGAQVIAARPVAKKLDELAEDESVAAVVLDIRSPGGSATASDVIWRSAERLGRQKPLVAVLGDVAASGGYYIAVAATEILCSPNTLTGSIGVVGGKLVTGGAIARLGVHSELVLGAPEASTFSSETAFTPVQRTRFRAGLERFYKAFVERVAAGRRRPYEVVEPLARGRVWTGSRAVEIGLVDRLGTVDDAIARASHLAGVESPAVIEVSLGLPIPRWLRLARAFTESVAPELKLLPRLPPVARLLAENPGVPLLLWPWELERT